MKTLRFLFYPFVFCVAGTLGGFFCSAKKISGIPVLYALSCSTNDSAFVLGQGGEDIIFSRYVSFHYIDRTGLSSSYYLDHDALNWTDARIERSANGIVIFRGSECMAIFDPKTCSYTNILHQCAFSPDNGRLEFSGGKWR